MSRKNTIAAIALVLCLLMASSCSNGPRVIGNPNVAGEVDTYLAAQAQEGKLSASVLIARRGEVLLDKGYGTSEGGAPNDSLTKHRICSISNVFTGAAILKLSEQGKLRLDNPIATFFPDFPRGDAITVAHLLTHTSGLEDLHDEDPSIASILSDKTSADDLVAMFRDKPLKFDPGTSYSYSNSGYVLLAAIIEKVSGGTYGDFLDVNIFKPAGMANSGEYGSGNLHSTTRDMYMWHQALMKDSVLSKESRLILGNVLRAYGQVDELSSGFVRYPSRDTVVVVLGRVDPSAQALCTEIVAKVMGSEEVALTDKQLKAYAGDYETDDYTFKITLDGGSLYGEAEGAARTRVVPLTGGDFLFDGLVTRFMRDDYARVTGIVARDLQEVMGDGILAVRVQ